MGDVNVAGHLSRKTIVRDLRGNIVTMLDEANGGYIIRNRQVVNPEKFAEFQRIEQDKRDAAKAISAPAPRQDAPDRTVAPAEAIAKQVATTSLEKRVDNMETKLDAILSALSKPKRKKKNEA